MSKWVDRLLLELKATGIPEPQTEYPGIPGRKFRFDLAWPDSWLAVEVDGGNWAGGRHVNPRGYARDCEKVALAMVHGWRVLRVVPEQIKSGEAVDWVGRLLYPGEGKGL